MNGNGQSIPAATAICDDARLKHDTDDNCHTLADCDCTPTFEATKPLNGGRHLDAVNQPSLGNVGSVIDESSGRKCGVTVGIWSTAHSVQQLFPLPVFGSSRATSQQGRRCHFQVWRGPKCGGNLESRHHLLPFRSYFHCS